MNEFNIPDSYKWHITYKCAECGKKDEFTTYNTVKSIYKINEVVIFGACECKCKEIKILEVNKVERRKHLQKWQYAWEFK